MASPADWVRLGILVSLALTSTLALFLLLGFIIRVMTWRERP